MNKAIIKVIKENYQPGVRIRLVSMEKEPQMPSGIMGVVEFVDDIGQIHTNWANGSTLALNLEHDVFIAFAGPTAEEYLRDRLALNDDKKTWYRINPLRFQISLIDIRSLIDMASRYLEKNVEITGSIAAMLRKPYNTAHIYSAFVADHVLSEEKAWEILLKSDFTEDESDEWLCPKCGADTMDYHETRLGDIYVETSWTCKSCGSVGKAYGKIEFGGHIVEQSPCFKEAQA